jgi:probable F420-dependent oxidoreductase
VPRRPFRFAVSVPNVSISVEEWAAQLRRIEEIGVDTIVAPDHFTQGYELEPFVALTAAAQLTSRIRLQTGVLGNDYRHPVLVHRMGAMLDVLSGGRLTIGLGAGWMVSDYEAAGIVYDGPGVRIDRLREAVKVIKGLFGREPFRFDGAYYTIRDLAGRPESVQEPRPPIFLGGGSPRVLRLAGAEADIVGIVASLRAGELGRHAVVDLSLDEVTRKIEWIKEGATLTGRRLDDIELEINNWLVRITATESEAEEFLRRTALRFDVEESLLRSSPAVLVGTVAACADKLIEQRERLGISFVQLDAGFAPRDLDSFVPLIDRLAGT